jgi:CRP-like cAMP-binding protein
MRHPLIVKLSQRDGLTPHEHAILEDATSSVETFDAGVDIVREGDVADHSCLILEGWTVRAKTLADGRRQITAFHIPGDFVDLHSFLLKPMDHTITALTSCKMSLTPHAALRRISEEHPHLTRMLWLSTLIDAAIHREWLVAIGRLSATAHLAHLLCELYLRLEVVGLAKDFRFEFPVTQTVLADALGLSTVHVNRVIQELRRDNLVAWRGIQVTIKDWDALVRIAEFDSTYLNLITRPR